MTHLVQDSQIDPLSKYQTISLSLLAYSERSSVAEDEGTRLKFLERNSKARAVIRGRVDFLSLASMIATTNETGGSTYGILKRDRP